MAARPPLPPLLHALLLLAGATLLALPGAARAAESAKLTLTVRGGAHDSFDRIVFDAPAPIDATLRRDGTHVTLHFTHPAQFNFRPLGAARLTRLRDATPSAQDTHDVDFSIAPQARLRSFRSGTSFVVDIYGPAAPPAEPPKAPPAATPPRTEAKAAPAGPAPAPAQTPEPPSSTAPAQSTPLTDSSSQSTPAPPAPSQSPPSQSTPDAAPPPAPTPTLAATPTPAAIKPPTETTSAPSKPAAAAKPEAAPAPKKTAPAKPEAPLLALGTTPELVAALDPKLEIGAAIFARANMGYIVFDRKLSLSLADLTAAQPPLRIQLTPLELETNSGYRFTLPPGAELHATRTGTAWQIFLSKQRNQIPITTNLVAQPDFALGARLLLPSANAPQPARFTDPTVGDALIVLPLRETEAFGLGHHFADTEILPSAQGLVLKPRHEKLIIRAVSDGVEITAEGGLLLSSNNDTGASYQSPQKARAAAAGKSLFDFALWGGKPIDSFTVTRQRMMQTIVDVPESERNRARLELARFYFAHGLGEETLGLLSFLAQEVPDLATRPDFLALRGGAAIVANHPQDGLRDLNDPELKYQPEIELWQAAAAAKMRDWKTAEEKFNITENILNGYPEPFYSAFSVLAVESALAIDKDREAAEWLDRLETQTHNPAVDSAILYLRGVIHGKSGHASIAENIWRNVTHGYDRLYKIRAELALIDLGVATHSLTPTQAADRLEGLRFAWRGDDLELDILHRLGGYYIDAGNFRPGLTTLAEAIRLYPDSPASPEIRLAMAKAFHDVFLTPAGNNLSPVETLTLYQDFRELMPSGVEGDAIGRNLAERLVAIDLLDQAGAILEDQVKNRLKGEEKVRTSTRLAAIRLLDNKADAAFAALELAKGETIPEALQSERHLLEARALSEQHKDDAALTLLQNNDSAPAKMLRADITMRAQRWDEAAKALQELIGPPPKAGATLKPEQAQWLVNCAIALSLSSNTTGLDQLAIDFGAAMAGTPQSATFRILTRPENGGQMRDITAAQSKISEVDMFRGFLDTYRKSSTEPQNNSDVSNAEEKKQP